MIQALVLLLALSQSTKASPSNLMGASKLLQGLGVKTAKPAHSNPFEKISREIDAYNLRSNSLSPQAAADGYLKLFADWEAAAGDQRSFQGLPQGLDQSPRVLMAALPRPEVWPLIRDGVAKQPDEKYKRPMLAAFDLLLGKDREVIKLIATEPKADDETSMFRDGPLKVQLPLALRLRDAELTASILKRAARIPSFFFFDGVPDLVSAFGAEKARPMLIGMLEAAHDQISPFNGEETQKLAVAIILTDLDHIKVPQWSLSEGTGRGEYVSKMVEKFGVGALEEAGVGEAIASYAATVASHGDPQAAADLLAKGNASYANLISLDASSAEALFTAFSNAIDKNPGANLWDPYVYLGKRLGKQAEVERRLDALFAQADLKPSVRRKALARKAQSAAEAGDEKGAVAGYVEASQLAPDPQRGDDVLSKLLAIGAATGNGEAIEAAVKAAEGPDAESMSASDVFDTLVSQGRLVEAQRHLLTRSTTSSRWSESGISAETPVMFAELYYRADRPQDVVDLLDSYPNWASNDLFELLDLRKNSNYREEFWRGPLGFYAAWAFAKTGRKELAIRTLHDLLSFNLAEDNAFRLLNELEGAPAIAFYDSLTRLDPFAPRPIAWKADLLLRLGQNAEAEKTARAAVSLDPTDGDGPPGRRLTSYDILARILHAEDKTEEADLYDRIVKAVRISERADLYRYAGLLPQALSLYQESSNTFADAYCVHARMGVTLMQQGKTAEALEHFRRAYELMPDSFGRIESFCLGCEGIFANSAQRNVALDVFKKLAVEYPMKPQVHYLLGLLMVETKDFPGAMASFETAVRLDPKYLNAWNQILALAGTGAASQPRLEQAALTVVRLDPLHLHGTYRALGLIHDYAELWRIYAAAQATLPPLPHGPLYPLLQQAKMDSPMFFPRFHGKGPADSAIRKSPGAGIGEVPEIQQIFNIAG